MKLKLFLYAMIATCILCSIETYKTVKNDYEQFSRKYKKNDTAITVSKRERL
jgi:hypothetical protein